MLTILRDFKLTQTSNTVETLKSVLSDLEEFKKNLPLSDKPVLEITMLLVDGFIDLCRWTSSSFTGEVEADRFLRAAKGKTLMAEEILPSSRFEMFNSTVRNIIEKINNTSNYNDIKDVAGRFQALTLPIFYLTEHPTETRGRNKASIKNEEKQPVNSGPFVIKVMFDVERSPWSNSQVLLPNTIYDISAQVTIPYWHEKADYLLIDYITTLTSDLYRISNLRIDRPRDPKVNEFELKGHVEFPVPQNYLSEPMIIKPRATFHSNSDMKFNCPVTIIGYHQLQVKVLDKSRTSLGNRSGFKSIDSRNLEIVDEVQRTITNLDSEHLNDFVESLNAVTNYMGLNLQQALYKDGNDISESDFQEDLLYHMRTWLGEAVKEAPKQGGGPTDIQYKTITIELKVEKNISDRQKMIEKYLSQPVQYSTASGAQLGILCILDLTEKHNPPANPQNQITLETPDVHGFKKGSVPFPTKIATVIVDGNLKLPSSYSRNLKRKNEKSSNKA